LDDDHPYRVVADSGDYQVTDGDGRVIMVCKDDRSAEHYAALLTQAFRQGYRMGYRVGKGVRYQ
jgi:hypothetical protein